MSSWEKFKCIIIAPIIWYEFPSRRDLKRQKTTQRFKKFASINYSTLLLCQWSWEEKKVFLIFQHYNLLFHSRPSIFYILFKLKVKEESFSLFHFNFPNRKFFFSHVREKNKLAFHCTHTQKLSCINKTYG